MVVLICVYMRLYARETKIPKVTSCESAKRQKTRECLFAVLNKLKIHCCGGVGSLGLKWEGNGLSMTGALTSRSYLFTSYEITALHCKRNWFLKAWNTSVQIT